MLYVSVVVEEIKLIGLIHNHYGTNKIGNLVFDLAFLLGQYY